MKLAQRLLSLVALVEAVFTKDEFSSKLDSIIEAPVKSSAFAIYKFNVKYIFTNLKTFDYFLSKQRELNDTGILSDNIYVEVHFNSGAKKEDEKDDSVLWDSEIATRNGFLSVSGTGAPSGKGGSATLLFGENGKLAKVIEDTLTGKMIEEGYCNIAEISVHCSKELYNLLKGTFGPSVG